MTENDFPCYYVNSDESSKKAQKNYKSFVIVGLFLMLISTIGSSLDSSLTDSLPYFNKINAVLLFLSALITILLAFFKPERNWYLGRAVAESIKTLSWRYMMAGNPFHQNNPDVEFIKRVGEITKQALKRGFNPKNRCFHKDAITSEMKRIRNLSVLERKELYARERIDNQITWYSVQSAKNKSKAYIFTIAIILCQLIAGSFILWFIDDFKTINITEVMVFLATSMISFTEMNKYKDLHQSYSLTRVELALIQARFGVVNSEQELHDFVLESEQAISREHTMWVARRDS